MSKGVGPSGPQNGSSNDEGGGPEAGDTDNDRGDSEAESCAVLRMETRSDEAAQIRCPPDVAEVESFEKNLETTERITKAGEPGPEDF